MDQEGAGIESHSTSVLESNEREVQELSEAEELERTYEIHRENFISMCVMRAEELSPEQRLRVAEYMRNHQGHWMFWNDDDVYVVDAEVQGNFWVITFCSIDSNEVANESVEKVPV